MYAYTLILVQALLLMRLSNRLFHRSNDPLMDPIHDRFDLASRFHLGITNRLVAPFFFPQPPFSISRKWRLTGSTCRPLADTNRFPCVPPCAKPSPLPLGKEPLRWRGQLENWRASINRGQLRCVQDDRARLTVLRLVRRRWPRHRSRLPLFNAPMIGKQRLVRAALSNLADLYLGTDHRSPRLPLLSIDPRRRDERVKRAPFIADTLPFSDLSPR